MNTKDTQPEPQGAPGFRVSGHDAPAPAWPCLYTDCLQSDSVSTHNQTALVFISSHDHRLPGFQGGNTWISPGLGASISLVQCWSLHDVTHWPEVNTCCGVKQAHAGCVPDLHTTCLWSLQPVKCMGATCRWPEQKQPPEADVETTRVMGRNHISKDCESEVVFSWLTHHTHLFIGSCILNLDSCLDKKNIHFYFNLFEESESHKLQS